jgi:hypothetical protein
MTQFYVYLKSNCCNALIHNGLFNIKKLNRCNDCNKKLVDIINNSYDIREIES